jgi:hypothetical protein
METKTFSQLLKNLGDVISKNSPTILTSLSVAGVVTTTVLAVKATPKAMRLIDEEKETRDKDELSKKDIFKLTWKLYLPSVCVGAATIGCIIGSNSINQRRNAALATVYGLTEAAFREYKEKVVETIGKNKELKVRDDISADKVKENPPSSNEVIFTGKGEVLCYDSMSGRYFKSDIEKIRRTINELNRELLSDMFIPLNDLYYELGLPDIKVGNHLGWDVDKGMIEVNFSSQLTEDGEPCLVLNYEVTPKYYVD